MNLSETPSAWNATPKRKMKGKRHPAHSPPSSQPTSEHRLLSPTSRTPQALKHLHLTRPTQTHSHSLLLHSHTTPATSHPQSPRSPHLWRVLTARSAPLRNRGRGLTDAPHTRFPKLCLHAEASRRADRLPKRVDLRTQDGAKFKVH